MYYSRLLDCGIQQRHEFVRDAYLKITIIPPSDLQEEYRRLTGTHLIPSLDVIVRHMPGVARTKTLTSVLHAFGAVSTSDAIAAAVGRHMRLWREQRGAKPLQTAILHALRAPDYKLHACVHNTAARGMADTWDALRMIDTWDTGSSDSLL